MTTSAPTSAIASDALAKRNVAVLVLCQAVMGAQIPLVFVVAGLAGTTAVALCVPCDIARFDGGFGLHDHGTLAVERDANIRPSQWAL
jgi:hypothetical protein